MASTSLLGRRRSAAQRHVVEEITREIRATDRFTKRKYLQDFSAAFQCYEKKLSRQELTGFISEADILLIGDYHALPASQRFAADVVEQLAASGREIVLAVEFVFTRDQHLLNRWVAGDIDGEELRERIRFDLDWGYDWEPFHYLLEAGRRCAKAVYGLDCTPRSSLRRINARDRHAALTISEVRQRHPGAVIVVLIGESHLAPQHLPARIRSLRPHDRVSTLLQNVDALYWRAAGEPDQPIEAVRVNSEVACVFNSTPLEKYESYRQAIERWRQDGNGSPDLAPAVYHMISGLVRFLNIDDYSPSTGSQAGLLVGRLPEVRTRVSDAQVRSMFALRGVAGQEVRDSLSRLHRNGACYSPILNTILVREFASAAVAEEASRFLHLACGSRTYQGGAPSSAEDRFYRRAIEEALAYFGSRALYPWHAPVQEIDLYALYSEPAAVCYDRQLWSPAEYMQMLDFLVLHKDYEANCRYYRECPLVLGEGVNWTGERFDFVTRWLGRLLGSQLHESYVSGRITRRFVRSLFLQSLSKPGAARTAYFVTASRTRKARRAR